MFYTKYSISGMGDLDTHSQFQLPDCWNDDVRMTALFAPPRSESINPHDWAGKLKFWKELILKWAAENNQLIISLEMLNEAFCRKGKYPVSLSRVLDEMNRLVPRKLMYIKCLLQEGQ